tara:strand:+ start:4578 stop:5345 length:768 start_codon:yes stop_codon:yes gene_type:complete
MAFDLSSIAKSGENHLPPRLVIYGSHGIGKTTFASSAKSPIFIPTEDGLAGVNVDAFPLATSFQDVNDALKVIGTTDNYKTIVIDSADWLESLIWNHTCAEHGKSSIEDFGYGKGYVLALKHWRSLLKTLDYFRTQHGMTTILLAHSEIKRYDTPDSESYDRYTIKLHKASSALIQEWADVVGFANWKVVTKQSDTGFGNKRTRGIGTGERLLHLEEKPSHVAKSRYKLPEVITLDWASFAKELGDSFNNNNNEV